MDVYTPTTIVNRGFRTNPNPNYARQYDPDNLAAQREPKRASDVGVHQSVTTPALITPSNAYAQVNGYTQSSTQSRQSIGGADYSSPLKPHHERLRERTPQKGDGGSLGVYNHANSPLRKAVSSSNVIGRMDGPQNRAAGSPLKRISTPREGLYEARRRDSGRI